ncbi:hypothetical protein ACFVOR_13005 [Streptomyces sp. NPDC057837]
MTRTPERPGTAVPAGPMPPDTDGPPGTASPRTHHPTARERTAP